MQGQSSQNKSFRCLGDLACEAGRGQVAVENGLVNLLQSSHSRERASKDAEMTQQPRIDGERAYKAKQFTARQPQ